MQTRKFRSLIAELAPIETMVEAQDWLYRVRDFLGVAHLVHHTINHFQNGVQSGILTWTQAWATRYISQGYITVDPTPKEARDRGPTNWADMDWSKPGAAAMLEDAVAHGMGSQGWSMPVWSPMNEFSVFSANQDTTDAKWRAFLDRNEPGLMMLAVVIDRKILQILGRDDRRDKVNLSPRESMALTWLALGQTRARAAHLMNISEATFRAHVDNAREKIGATDITHAVAQAVAMGLCAPTPHLVSTHVEAEKLPAR